AIAFVLEHPAVSAAIIGPRTMDQLDDLLAGTGVRLDADVLDRIDEIVPPGTSISGADPWQPRSLRPKERRRPPRGCRTGRVEAFPRRRPSPVPTPRSRQCPDDSREMAERALGEGANSRDQFCQRQIDE